MGLFLPWKIHHKECTKHGSLRQLSSQSLRFVYEQLVLVLSNKRLRWDQQEVWVNVFEMNVLKWMFLSECFWKECFQMLTCTKSRLADRPRAMQWKQQVQKYACIQHVVTTSVKYEAELSYNNTLFSTPTRWSAQQHTDQHIKPGEWKCCQAHLKQ